MRGFRARYFDGHTSRDHPVEVRWEADGAVEIHGDGITRRYPLAAVRVSGKLGVTRRLLHLPDGGRCESDHDTAMDALARATRRTGPGVLVRRAESRWSFALGACVLSAALLWVTVEYGLPLLARHVAHAVPPELEHRLGAETLRSLDAAVLVPSRLPPVDRQRVERLFDTVARGAGAPPHARLELRGSNDLGPNALALPAGIVVLTDAMVQLAESDGALTAVIAHELGHVSHRHVLRAVLQGSAVALLIAAALGDVTSVTGLAASVPTFLLEQRYSRQFEYEADRFALELLIRAGIDPKHFVDLLTRMVEERGPQSKATRYLSSHPSSAERIDALRAEVAARR